MILIEEYDNPPNYVKVKAVSSGANLDDENSVSYVIFDQVREFIQDVAQTINNPKDGETIN